MENRQYYYYLKIQLQGAFQCYSKGRTSIAENGVKIIHTEKFPTRSAVIGLVAAAFGYARDEYEQEIKELSDKLTVYGETKGHENPVITRDYQRTPHSDEPAVYREYLTNESFILYLKGEHDFLLEVYEKLLHPWYTLYLGKGNCLPSTNIARYIIETVYPRLPEEGIELIEN